MEGVLMSPLVTQWAILEIRLACQSCPFTHQQYSCQRIRGSADVTVGFEVNDSMVMCFNELGCGEAAMRKFSAIMRIPGFAHRTYRLSKKVGNAHSQVTANVLNAAVAAVRRTYADANDDFDANEENDNDDTGDSTNSSDVDSVASHDLSHDLAGDDHVMMHSDSNISSVELGDSDSDRGNFGDHNSDWF
ncbi:uncharacterized protein [Littorina saxatilis]|uniref:Mutator-like transposase domain-containing protein n=1 Tax=Littorina saxatilis TaxID=31220 RepID=A0AAN9BIM1_9CAEN